MGLFKKKIMKKTYDREHMKPVIRASICTGEEVAGFKDIRTGKIEEIMLMKQMNRLDVPVYIGPGLAVLVLWACRYESFYTVCPDFLCVAVSKLQK